jgi:hypothetical protein
MHYEGRTQRVHRISAMIFLGYKLFDDKQINHKCEEKACWNPEHLYIGTGADNAHDRDIDSSQITHCKYGHELTEDNISWGNKGARNCKICARERANRYYREKEK